MFRMLMLAAGLCSYVSYSNAMNIEPFTHSFVPAEKTTQYTLQNKNDIAIAFEITICRRAYDLIGKESLTKDENSFVVFPTQVIIPAKSSRRIKVKWIGNDEFQKNPKCEQAYRVIFDQYYINLDEKQKKQKGACLEVRLQMIASLYMTPKGAVENLQVDNVKQISSSKFKVTLCNLGTKRAFAEQCKASAMFAGKRFNIADVLNKKDYKEIIMAGSKREFEIDITIEVETKAGRQA